MTIAGTEKEFTVRCKDAKARLNLVAQEIARLVVRAGEHHALQKNVARLQGASHVLQDIRQQCDWLLGKEWVARTPYERMQQMPPT